MYISVMSPPSMMMMSLRRNGQCAAVGGVRGPCECAGGEGEGEGGGGEEGQGGVEDGEGGEKERESGSFTGDGRPEAVVCSPPCFA